MGQLVAKEPDLTLVEIKQRLELNCTIGAIHWVLARLGLTYKKDTPCGRTKPVGHRQRAAPVAAGPGRAGLRPACLPRQVRGQDEPDAPARVRPKGERLVCHAPGGHCHTTTTISSVRLYGTSACMTIEGATNIEVFQAYVREILPPVLRPGEIVIPCNLGAHKNEQTLALIR